jgi:hypothetical protein
VTAALCVALPVAARTRPGTWTRLVGSGLAVLLIAAVLAYPLVVGLGRSYALDFDLPLHLTDAVTVVAALALWSLRPRAFELTYFWGLAASACGGAHARPRCRRPLPQPPLLALVRDALRCGGGRRLPRLRTRVDATLPRGRARVPRDGGMGGCSRRWQRPHRRQLHVPPEAAANPEPARLPGHLAVVHRGRCAALLALALFALLDLPFRRRRAVAEPHVAGARPGRR